MPILFGLTLIIIVFISFSKSRDKIAKKSSKEFWQREQESHFVPKKDISSLDYITIPYSSLPFRYYTPGAGTPVRIAGSPVTASSPADFSDETGSFSVVSGKANIYSEIDSILQEVDASFRTAPDTVSHTAPLSEELAAAELELCKLSHSKILNLTGISNTELRLTYGTANLDFLTSYDQNFTTMIRTLQKWGTLLSSAGRREDAIAVLSYAVSAGSDIAGTYALLARLYKEQGNFSEIENLKASAEQLTTLMKPSILRDLEQLSANRQ